MDTPFSLILLLFIIYGTFNTAMGAHQWIYPNELFPTHIRGTAMGFITGVTRFASAIGTFVFPFILGTFGLAVSLYICGALLFLGFLISLFMAPETKNMSLAETSAMNKAGNLKESNIPSSENVMLNE
ncbi:hypothetical protein AU377_05660 [Sporosarcina sp. HYO08]|nr:hypothetical protein AU377_05660 [Sporosarcina sp. HYO08]